MSQLFLMGLMGGAAVLGAVGQIALKKATEKLQFTPMALITNYWLLLFFALYGIAVLVNIYAYKAGGKVSLIYPMISLSYIFAAVFAWKFLGEAVSMATVCGILLIMGGVSLIGLGAAY